MSRYRTAIPTAQRGRARRTRGPQEDICDGLYRARGVGESFIGRACDESLNRECFLSANTEAIDRIMPLGLRLVNRPHIISVTRRPLSDMLARWTVSHGQTSNVDQPLPDYSPTERLGERGGPGFRRILSYATRWPVTN